VVYFPRRPNNDRTILTDEYDILRDKTYFPRRPNNGRIVLTNEDDILCGIPNEYDMLDFTEAHEGLSRTILIGIVGPLSKLCKPGYHQL
jgi:hypothetical protein